MYANIEYHAKLSAIGKISDTTIWFKSHVIIDIHIARNIMCPKMSRKVISK